MKLLLTLTAAALLCTAAAAHEMTPTYPEFKLSHVDNVVVTTMSLWNRRNDVSFYEIDVFDENMKPIKFATSNKILELSYLEKRKIEIYIRESDERRVKYICTSSKHLKRDTAGSSIKSTICSKIVR